MTHTVNERPPAAPRLESSTPEGRSTADLVKLAAEQISTLVRDELKLAQTELTAKGKKAGLGVGMFGGAGVVALYGVGAVLASLIIGLSNVMPPWLAALLVGIVLFAVAGILAVVGRKEVRKATPALPKDRVESVKADINTVTEAVKDRGHR